MTIKELKEIINSIPQREDDRVVEFCGSLFEKRDIHESVEVSWMDCSDGMLLFINEKNDEI